MPPDPAARPRLSAAQQADIERWFVRQGVPQLIAGYASEPAMDARAAPLLLVWLVLGTIWWWGVLPGSPLVANAIGVVATLVWFATVWTAVRRVRGRPTWGPKASFDLIDIATLALLPAAPAAVIEGSVREAVTAALGALTGIGVVYLLVGFGIPEIGVWAGGRLWRQLADLVGLGARTLPILLIIVIFVLFSSEIWQVASGLTAVEITVFLVLLLILSALIVWSSFRRVLGTLEHGTDRDVLLAEARETPAGAAPAAKAIDTSDIPRLRWLERINVGLVVVVPALLQVVVAGFVVSVFLAAFGWFMIPEPVQTDWIGQAPRVLASGVVLGEPRALTAEVLIVSSLLGGIVGLYFGGLAISDPTYRAEHYDRDIATVRRILAARAVYLDGLRPIRAPADPIRGDGGAERL